MSTQLATIIADFSTQLSAQMAVGATSGTLVSATDSDGVALPTGRYFLTIDGTNSSKEHISCTLTGTALTNIKTVSRQGTETSGTLRLHRVGASVTITDFAHIKMINDLLNGTTDFDSAVNLGYDGAPVGLTGNNFATVDYVLSVVSGGSVTFDQQVVANQVAGETLAVNDLVYFKEADQRWWLADADLSATFDQVQLGITKTAGAAAAAITVAISGPVSAFTGLTAGSKYYLSNTAGAISTTPGTTSVFLGWALSTTQLLFNPLWKTIPSQGEKNAMAGGGNLGTPSSSNKFLTESYVASASGMPVTRVYATSYGSTTTRIDVTNPSGTTFRYTYDGTGTDPGITALTFPVGYKVIIAGRTTSAGNHGLFTITGSGANYFEVTNASGGVEANMTLDTGYLINYNPTWTKPSGLKYVRVRLVGGGGSGAAGEDVGDDSGGGGGAGGYSEKIIPAASLGSTETVTSAAFTGTSSFGSHLQATGGASGSGNAGGLGGVGSGGDFNNRGQGGMAGSTTIGEYGGNGGASVLGGGALAKPSFDATVVAGFGGGGAGGDETSSDPGTAGGAGVVIVTEYYS